MAIIIARITSNLNYSFTMPGPSFIGQQSSNLVIPANAVDLDLLTLTTDDGLWSIQPQLIFLERTGQVTVTGTIDTASFDYDGVSTIHADSSPAVRGNIHLVSGSNITLSQVGQDITINSSGGGGGGSPSAPNTSIQFNNSGAFGGSASLTWDGTQLITPLVGADINTVIAFDGGSSLVEIYASSTNIRTGVFTAQGGGAVVGGSALTPSSILDVQSTGAGFLPPRMTTTQRNAIPTPATGLQIYNTTTNQPEVYNGSVWSAMSGGSGSPAGVNQDVQFNDNGAFGADDTFGGGWFTYDIPTHTLNVGRANIGIFQFHQNGSSFFGGGSGSAFSLINSDLGGNGILLTNDPADQPSGNFILTDTTNATNYYNNGVLLGTSATGGNITLTGTNTGFGQIAVGTIAPDASASVDISSVTRGFLPPRMTQVQRDAIASPAAGLQVYNTTLNEPEVYNGTAWVAMASGGLPSGLTWDGAYLTLNAQGFVESAGDILIGYHADAQLFIQGIPESSLGADDNTWEIHGDTINVNANAGINVIANNANLVLQSTGGDTVFNNASGNLRTGTVTGQVNLHAGESATLSADNGGVTLQSTTSDPITLDVGTGGGVNIQTNAGNNVWTFSTTGSLLSPNGTAAIPASSFTADPTSGWYYDPVNISVNLSLSGQDWIIAQSAAHANATFFANGDVRVQQDFRCEQGDLFTPNGGANLTFLRMGETLPVTPVASSIAQIDSTVRGFLPPRMTTTQKNAIATPAEGLMVYDTTLHKLCVFTGSAWQTITSV